MTTVLTNLFENKTVRVFEKDGDLWLPIADLASAWGTDRTTPHNLITRNMDLFAGMTLPETGDVTSPSGVCVNERGLYLLMGKISASRLKHPAAKESIIRFQRWVPELIQKYRKKEIVQMPKSPDYAGIIEKIKFVNELAILTGWNRTELQKEVLRESGMHALTYHIEPAKPVALPRPKDYLTATDIGERIGKTAHEVNTFLYQHKPPMITKDQKGEWRLTETGHDYGSESIRELEHGAFVWRIKWKREVLRLFNVHDHEEMG